MRAASIAAGAPRHAALRSYLLEAKYESLRLLRTPSFVLPVILFPAVFYLFFGVMLGRADGGQAARYLMATYGVFGVMGAGLFGFGMTVAVERERGLLAYKRALPMPPGAYLLAKMAMAMLFAAAISLLLALLGTTLGGVSLAPAQWLLLFAIDVLGVLPFCAIGLWIGTLVGGQGAPAVLNMLYLPMAFLSGLWLPLSMLPRALQRIAPVWPSYHLNQLTQAAVGLNHDPLLGHVLALAGFAAVFLWLAARRLRRNG